MALFKIFKGDSSLLSSQHIHEGYCYLTTDEKKLYVDISDSQRIVLNSEAASKIQTADGQELSIEEIFENNNNIFIALPNITTPSQVKDALDDGKMIFVRDDNNIYYPLVATAGSGQNITYVFDTLVGNNRSGYNLISNTGEWRSVSTSLATLESPQFSGNPLTPNITSSSSGLQIANKNYVDNANNLFVAIINQTTFEEIRNAYNSGKYIGQVVNGIREGKGIYYWNTGEIYEGEWKNDKMEGKGIKHFQNGNIYEGYWRNDQQNGRGIFHWSNGTIYEGTFRNNLFHGKGILYFADGTREMGDFHNEKRIGKHVTLTINGDVKIKNY